MQQRLLTQDLDGLSEVLSLESFQLSLAIADQISLRSLLLTSMPPILAAHQLGHIRAEIGVLLPHEAIAIDAVLQYEEIQCVLAPIGLEPSSSRESPLSSKPLASTHSLPHQSDIQTLGENLSLSEAMTQLTHAGFTGDQIERILYLPYDAWYKSWWYELDAAGYCPQPFQRHIRTRRFRDGKITLQYKDLYLHHCPTSFKSYQRRLPVQFRGVGEPFLDSMKRINTARMLLETSQSLLVTTATSDLEVQGFINQGVSVYIPMPHTTARLPANCVRCHQLECPMQGNLNSPVLTCKRFSRDAQDPD